jgi:hypothetical protein
MYTELLFATTTIVLIATVHVYMHKCCGNIRSHTVGV